MLSMMYRERKENVLWTDLNKICSGDKSHVVTDGDSKRITKLDYHLAGWSQGSKVINTSQQKEALNMKQQIV